MRPQAPVLALALLLAGAVPGFTLAQSADEPAPLYDINVVGMTTTAVNYKTRSASTSLNMEGTPLLPRAEGTVVVNPGKGAVSITLRMRELAPASRLSPLSLTYVAWAVSPEGRAVNLGELIANASGNARLETSARLQAFAIIVSAEPYFAVTLPSDLVVAENVLRSTTVGQADMVRVKTDLMPRGRYAVAVPEHELTPVDSEGEPPLDLLQARNAIRIAGWAGAREHAADVLAKAEARLAEAESAWKAKSSSRTISTSARAAVQAAEDSRVVAIRRTEEARVEQDKAEAAAREAEAKAATEAEAQRRETAEAEQRVEADRRARAEADERAARIAAEQADMARQRAEQEKAEMRAQLLRQFNMVLDTRETERGLVVNMSDVLFESGKHALAPAARERLARISGILAAHPSLRLEIEGHTDSTGTADFNQRLSEQRAESVREYLLTQGIPGETMTARGLGPSQPVAENADSEGRAKNRRVELIVSGEIIGTKI